MVPNAQSTTYMLQLLFKKVVFIIVITKTSSKIYKVVESMLFVFHFLLQKGGQNFEIKHLGVLSDLTNLDQT